MLNLFISCISAKSGPQILSIKYECIFLFSNFLIIDLCNSSANYLLDIILFLTAPPEADLSGVTRLAKVFNGKASDHASEVEFYTKIYRPLKQVHVDIHHILDF